MNNNPYLSVVVVSRNDNHGGDLTGRTQIFINSLFAQADRHEIPMELVFVEWNPPQDKAPVLDAFTWPESKFCKLKIVTVPAEEHKKILHSDGLPLFQMIGKNVGIRNSDGEYILVTNIDVILSDKICDYIKYSLEKGTIYRCDRWDADKNIPITNCIDEILDYCNKNLIRFQKAGYTCSKIPCKKIEGKNYLSNTNFFTKSLIGEFFYSIEYLLLDNIKSSYNNYRKLKESDRLNSKIILKGVLNWIKLLWKNFFNIYGAFAGAISGYIITFLLFKKDNSLAEHFVDSFLAPCFGSFFTSCLGSFIGSFIGAFIGAVAGSTFISVLNHLGNLRMYLKCKKLHTNACGDFMLMDRKNWFKSRGYYEKPMYSWHIDSMFMFLIDAMKIKCIILPEDHIIYHIEHGGGWTPETEKQLFENLKKRNVPYFTWQDLIKIEKVIRRNFKKSIYFNRETWGIIQNLKISVR